MARSSLLAAWGRLAHSRCATQRAERQRQRPDAEIAFGGEISCRPPMRVARGVPALDDFTNEAYSALMLAALMTFPHVSVSPLMRAVNSSGVLPTGSKPSAAKRSFISGDAMLLTISRWSTVTMSFGVLAGTRTPIQFSPSSSGYPASAMVGMSGRSCERALLATERARKLPSRMLCTAWAGEPKVMVVWPATTEAVESPPLLNGTCTRSRPRATRNCSPERWDCVAVPPDAKLYLPGLALIRLTSSATVFAGTEGLTESTTVSATATVTGSKSL